MLFEHVGPGQSYLAGTLTTPVHLLGAGHSLKLMRPFDALSPRIAAAMTAQSTLPRLEIDTPDSKITLLNAKIVNIAHPSHGTPKGGGSHRPHKPSNFGLGIDNGNGQYNQWGLLGARPRNVKLPNLGQNNGAYSLEELELTFQNIICVPKSSKKG